MAGETHEAVARPELAVVISEVLSDLAFLLHDDEASAVRGDAEWLEALVEYRGPTSGRLTCWCTREFAVLVAANVLGLDIRDADAADSAEDALREFMNIVCGQLVTAWYGKTAVFTLSIPQVSECFTSPRLDAAEGRCRLYVERTPLICEHKSLTPT